MSEDNSLASALALLGFVPDPATGGYRKGGPGGLWISAAQARDALGAAKAGTKWTVGDVDPLSETLAKRLTEYGIK